jgi:hypothetical protein
LYVLGLKTSVLTDLHMAQQNVPVSANVSIDTYQLIWMPAFKLDIYSC